jgi:hypothetical protein
MCKLAALLQSYRGFGLGQVFLRRNQAGSPPLFSAIASGPVKSPRYGQGLALMAQHILLSLHIFFDETGKDWSRVPDIEWQGMPELEALDI